MRLPSLFGHGSSLQALRGMHADEYVPLGSILLKKAAQDLDALFYI